MIFRITATVLLLLSLLAVMSCSTDDSSSDSYYTNPLPSDLDTFAFMADTQIVRAILDSNKLTTVSVWWDMIVFNDKIRLSGSRISILNLEGLSPSLTRIPADIGGLSELTELWVRNHGLTSLPAEIGNLRKLTKLFLNVNKISQLPANIRLCTALQTLYVANNQLVKLPDSIGSCTALRELEVGNNQLTSLPESIVKLSNVSISVMKNRLCTANLSDTLRRWLDVHAVEGPEWGDTIRFQTCP